MNIDNYFQETELGRLLETRYSALSESFRLRDSDYGLVKLGAPAAQGFTRAQLVRALNADIKKSVSSEVIDASGWPRDACRLDFQALLPRMPRKISARNPLESPRTLVMTSATGELYGVLGYRLLIGSCVDEDADEVDVTLSVDVAYVCEAYRGLGFGRILAEECVAQLLNELVYVKALLEEYYTEGRRVKIVPTLSGEFVSRAGQGLAGILLAEANIAAAELNVAYGGRDGYGISIEAVEDFTDQEP